ncbi:hypothetical protein ABPG77_004665 [Micractinium sp. CCAP 211/92]
MAPVRLYVGGLPPDVTEEQLRARFTPFGAVSACCIAPPKVYGGASFPRNFGHVELEPRDEASLRRCISAYNGCRWKGAVLKCALARPHYLERLHEAEPEAGAQDEEASAAATRPPLGPGCVLRLRPPKAPAVVEVALDSGSKRVQFPEPNPSQQEQQQGGAASWEPLQAPPCSGYRFEAHLQRIAADLPPELVAAVEARRERGRRLAEARERAREEAAGMEVAYQYSEESGSSGSLQLDSDDDAATAAAAAAAAMSARERRMAAAAGAAGAQAATSARLKAAPAPAARPQQHRVPRLGVVDFAAGEGPLAASKGAAAAANLSRFDSDADSDADLAAPAPGRATALPSKPVLPKALPASQQQQVNGQQRQPRQLAAAAPPQPSASSDSSGGSELEEWLAAQGAGGTGSGPDHASSDSDSDSDSLGGRPAAGDRHAARRQGLSGVDVRAAGVYASDQEEGSSASSGSSGGSELEEWLAAEGELQGSDGEADKGAAEGDAAAEAAEEGEEEEEDGGSKAWMHAAAGTTPGRHGQQQRQQAQRAVVDFLEEGADPSGRQWWQKPSGTLDTDLSRFASSDEDEGGDAPPAAADAPARASAGRQRGKLLAEAPQPGRKAKRARVIPQVDGAADSDSESEEEPTASEGGSRASSSSDSGPGSGSSSSSDEEGEGQGAAADDSGSSSSNEASSESGSSSEEEEEAEEDGGTGNKSAKRANAAGADAAQEASSSEEEEEKEEGAATAAAQHEAAARQAEEAEQQRRLAALFPEGASFLRSEPLAQIEAAWRVNRDAWVQDFRQKHRQAVRLMGRAANGGGGKRQRKG